ncbi:hypothetical protein [Photobacterium sanguinicancri]|uniref:hypothetical protein n=1 Tax=Photobacterium sanguinicancri TaxID=875932 RepID=UPI0026E33462|nr:hypothetical protein [Photobacterium sanguinicancri]MDO6500917.1 hypothetical protein [Photobacterium sanguinicancri]
MKKLAVIAISVSLLGGCANRFSDENRNWIKPVSVSSICVTDNAKVTFDMKTMIEQSAINNNVEVNCTEYDAKITYTAQHYFDLHKPLANATLNIIDNNDNLIGGFSFYQAKNMFVGDTYFSSNEEILNPILDEMFNK